MLSENLLSYMFLAMTVVITAMFILGNEGILIVLTVFQSLGSFSFILLYSIVISEKTVQLRFSLLYWREFHQFYGDRS